MQAVNIRRKPTDYALRTCRVSRQAQYVRFGLFHMGRGIL